MLQSSTHAAAGDYWDSHVLASGLDRHTIERLSRAVTAPSRPRDRIAVPVAFTSEPLGTVPRCTPEDIYEAVRIARAAQRAWAERSLAGRRSVLLRFHDLVLDRREQALDLIQLESGKARAHALEEILDTALVARHYALHGKNYLRPRRRPAALPIVTTAWEHRHPVGVAGFITPWNFPQILGDPAVYDGKLAGRRRARGAFTSELAHLDDVHEIRIAYVEGRQPGWNRHAIPIRRDQQIVVRPFDICAKCYAHESPRVQCSTARRGVDESAQGAVHRFVTDEGGSSGSTC